MRYFQCIIICLFVLLYISCGSFLLPPLEITGCLFDSEGVSLSFSAKPTPESVRNAFTLTEDGSTLSGTFGFEGRSVVFKPVNGIRTYRNYKLVVSAGAEDEKGNSLLRDFIYTYTTKRDSVAPTVLRSFPENESNLSGQPDSLELFFSEPVDTASFYSALSISPSFNYVCIFSDTHDAVSIVPTSPLTHGTRYVVTVSTALTDVNRNGLVTEFSLTFLYGLDRTPPEYVLSYKTETVPSVLSSELENTMIPSNAEFNLAFNEPVEITSVGTLISVVPDVQLRIIPDKETETSVSFVFSSIPEWGNTYVFTIKKGISDIFGNKTLEDNTYSVTFNNERCRPVTFIKGYVKNGATYTVWDPAQLYASMILDSVIFPTTTGSNETDTDLYLFFRVSSDSTGINPFSAMEHISVSATNGCADFTLKTVSVLTEAQYAADAVYASASLDPALRMTGGGMLCVIKGGLEIANNDKKGLITLSVGKDIADSLGNKMPADSVCIVNKK